MSEELMIGESPVSRVPYTPVGFLKSCRIV